MTLGITTAKIMVSFELLLLADVSVVGFTTVWFVLPFVELFELLAYGLIKSIRMTEINEMPATYVADVN